MAHRLVKRGAKLALIARDQKKLAAVKHELTADAPGDTIVEVFSCDVSDADAVDKTIIEIAGALGPPDILINSAGILRESHFQNQTLDTFREVMDINYFGALHCIKAVLPYFMEKKSGRIVNVSSLAGLFGVFGYAAYCSSKHAVIGLSSAIRAELKPRNIIVQVVCPPEFESPMVDDINTYRSYENARMAKTLPVMTAETVADAMMKGIEKNRYMIITGAPGRITVCLERMFPWLGRYVIDSRIKKFDLGN